MKKTFNILLIFILSLTFIFSYNYVLVNAETNNYTDVFDDLRKDENFDISNYPIYTLDYIQKINNDTDKTNDQSYMEVIQIAESSSDEFYIYVYKPCYSYIDLIASSILMSDEYSPDGQNIYPDIYNLELVSTYKQFDKYVVKDFVVSDETYRYYNLVTLYRLYNSEIDKLVDGSESDNIEIGMEIGQQWSCYYLNDTLVYEMGTFETLEIEIDYTGHFEFSSGIKWGNFVGLFDYGHSWFIAFSTDDYVIKHIYDADLTYRERSARTYWQIFNDEETTYGEWSDDIKITLSDTDEPVTYDGGGLFSKEYTWNRISSSSDFLANAEDQDVKISDECKTKLQESQWVFAFKETELNYSSGDGWYRYNYTDIDKVTIIRLHFFDIHDDVYNLGVVSDRVNPDNKADGNGSGIDIEKFQEMFEKIMAILGFLLLVVVISFITPVANILSLIFKLIFKGIYIIVSLPFKIVGKLFNIGKKNKP